MNMNKNVLEWFLDAIERGNGEDAGSMDTVMIDGIEYICSKTAENEYGLYREDGFLPELTVYV